MITVENATEKTATTDKKYNSVLVYRFEIADQLLGLGYRIKRIVADKRYPDKHKPVFLFHNDDGIEKTLEGLIDKARADYEKRVADGQTRNSEE